MEGGAKNFGVFRMKNHDFTPKNHIFPIAEGGARPGSALESYGCLAPLSTIFQLHRNFRCKFIMVEEIVHLLINNNHSITHSNQQSHM